MRFDFIYTFITLSFFLSSCGDRYDTVATVKVDAKAFQGHSSDSVILDPSGKFYFSRIWFPNSAGMIATYTATPDQFKEAICLVARGRVRTNYAQSNALVVFAGSTDKKENLFWRFFTLRSFFTDQNEWSYFRDSIFIPPHVNGKQYSEIFAAAWLGDSKKEFYDMDSLELIIKQKR